MVDYKRCGNDIFLKDKNFKLEHTFECGQCFRYEKIDENNYYTILRDRILYLEEIDGGILLKNVKDEELEYIFDYFDLNTNYDKIKEILSDGDENLEKAIKEKWGIHLLKQDLFETYISFIISQSNQIPRIRSNIKAISKKYGKRMYDEKIGEYYLFPTKEELSKATEEELRDLKLGYRAEYIVIATKYFIENNLTYEYFEKLSYEESIKELIKIKGIGLKVANCIALFSLKKVDAFPVDTWVIKLISALYLKREAKKKEVENFVNEKFKIYGGYAQQYLFYYARDNKISIKNKE